MKITSSYREVRVQKARVRVMGGKLFFLNLNRLRSILTWLRGFRVKLVNCLNIFCLTIPKRDLDTKKTTPIIEVCAESLLAMFEY